MRWLLCGGVVVGLSYADAVRLMGGRDRKTVAALDSLTGGLLWPPPQRALGSR